MNDLSQYTIQLPPELITDVGGYRRNLEAFRQGHTTAIAFQVYRVAMGVYEERSAEKFMVRIRIGAGLVTPEQLEKIAELSQRFGNGVVHVTTRQDIQLHGLDIADTADVLEQLLQVNLAGRGGGGNTVRNITADPRSGVNPQEVFNVAPYAVALAEFLLAQQNSYNMPRKLKIAFSATDRDPAMARANDLGFVARQKDGQQGFAVFAAGGLGSEPTTAVQVEEFVETGRIFEIAQAVKNLFNDHGNRTDKHHARLRFVRKKLGDEKFTELYHKYRTQLADKPLPGVVPQIKTWQEPPAAEEHEFAQTPYVLAENAKGYYSIKIPLDKGDITADDLNTLAELARRYSHGLIRTSQLQNLLLSRIPAANVSDVLEQLNGLESVTFDNSPAQIVSCTGARTCKLGLCLSRNLADAIKEQLKKTTPAAGGETVIRISGCPNSCASHYIAQLGFQGSAKRVNGKLMPWYQVLAGGSLDARGAKLADKFGDVPARHVPALAAELLKVDLNDPAVVADLVNKHAALPDKPGDEYYYDFGADQPFSLAGRGPGQCGSGVIDVITLDIKQARRDLAKAKENNSAQQLYDAVLASARALLVLFGLEPVRDREVFAGFTKHLLEPGWAPADTGLLIDRALDWKLGQEDALDGASDQAAKLIERIEELFKSLDSNLKFTAEPAQRSQPAQQEKSASHKADLRGVACPLNFVKAKLQLEAVELGQTLEIMLDKGEPERNVPASFQAQGQAVLSKQDKGQYVVIAVKRVK